MPTSESVSILIDAEDRASAKLAIVSANAETEVMKLRAAFKKMDQSNLDAQVKGMREFGQRTKVSTEVVGVLANALGGTAFGHYAQQLAQLTEKFSSFSEILKTGGAGALAFKAGLMGLTAVISFQVGKAIGNVIWQTEKWKKALADAGEQAKKTATELLKVQAVRFGRDQEDIELIRDPKDKRAAQESMLSRMAVEIDGIEKRMSRNKATIQEWDGAWNIAGRLMAESAKETLALDQDRLKVQQERQEALRYELSAEKAERDAKRKANIDEEKHKLKMIRLREEDSKDAMDRLDKFKQLNEQVIADIQKEKDSIREDRIKQATAAISDFGPKDNKQLLEMIRLREEADKKALDRLDKFKQSNAGVPADIQKEKDSIREDKFKQRMEMLKIIGDMGEKNKEQLKARSKALKQPLQAEQSRLLTRVTTRSSTDMVADNTKLTNVLLKDVNKKLDEANRKEKADRELAITLVGP